MFELKAKSVAQYIDELIELSPKSQKEIANEIGYQNQNVITMFKQGLTKVPLNKVGPLARALNADPEHLLRVVLEEYMPDTWRALERDGGRLILSDDEEQLVLAYRLMRMRIPDGELQASTSSSSS